MPYEISMSHELNVQSADHELEFHGFRYLARTATAGAHATEPVVIIGGSSQDRLSWTRYESQLLPHASMLTLELPGYGEADPLPTEYGMDFLAGAVAHAIDVLVPGRVNLFGGCFGASISLHLVQLRPHLVSRLMLLGFAASMSPRYVASAHRWRLMWQEGRLDAMVQDMLEQFMAPPERGFVRRRAAVQRLMRQRWTTRSDRALAMDFTHRDRLLAHPWWPSAPAVTGRPLVVTGEHDILTPPDAGRQVACLLGGRFTTIKEADHLVHLERDADVAELMAHYFTEQPLEELPYLNAIESMASIIPEAASSATAP
jgi:pimeloyl-ACP methyl ester carboxylesterase